MSELDNNGAAAADQNQGYDPFDVFNNAPIPMMTEDEGLIKPYNPFVDPVTEPAAPSEPIVPENKNQQQQQNQNQDDNQQNQDSEEGFNFKDEIVEKYSGQGKDEKQTIEQAMQLLKEQGFNVEKPDNNSPDHQENLEFERITGQINYAKDFLNKSDDEVIKEKVYTDLSKKYSDFGKGNLIGSEEFNDDVEMELEQISASSVQKKMYADNIRNNVSSFLKGQEKAKEQIIQNREDRNMKAIAEKRRNLQSSIQNISKSKFLGLDVNPEQAQEVYNDITSGNFTKTINENPDLVAKFAFFIKNLESIENNLSGATYGEGVKATVDAIRGNKAQQSRSPIHQALSNAQGGNVDKLSRWRDSEIEPQEQPPVQNQGFEKPYVAGRGML